MIPLKFIRHSLALCLFIQGLWIAYSSALAQTDSTWLDAPNSIDWFDPLNWDNGIPKAPGDSASITGRSSIVLLELNAHATIGTLNLLGRGSIAIGGSGPLHFENPGADPASIQTVPSSFGSVATELSVPVSIASGEELLINLAPLRTVNLSGGLASPDGDITKTGAGSLTLSTDNSVWGGSLAINGGDVIISDVNALANSQHVRIGPNSRLIFVPQDVTGQRDDDYVIPNVSIDGGIIQTNQIGQGSRIVFTDTDMNLDLVSDSSIRLSSTDWMNIEGNIGGAGGLHFLKIGGSGGSAFYPYLTIDGTTSYSGETIIGPGVRVAFRQSAALGDTAAGTLVDRGTLELHAGGGSEQIEVRRGRLALIEAIDPYGHEVFLDQGQLFGGDDDGLAATLNTTVHFFGGAALGTSGGGDHLVLAGGISGIGSLFSLNQVEIQGELAARGNFIATNRGPARISGKLSQAGDVFVSDTQLELTGDLESPRGTFFLNPDFIYASLVAKHTNTLESVVIDPRSADRDSFHELFRLIVEDGVALSITDELRFFGGTLRGAITGQNVLTKKDRAAGVVEDIRGSQFTRINVDAGLLTLRGDAGDSPPEIHLGAHDTSRLVIANAGTYLGDIFLNNVPGNVQQAALMVSGNTTLAGNIYLGDRGSSISTIVSSGEVAEITGVIHGGDFTVLGRQEIRLRSGNHTYTGATQVLAENFRLVGEGKLNSTSMIVGHGRLSGGGGRAGLILDNRFGLVHDDRIPDATPVYLNGMKLTLLGRGGFQVTENLGAVHVTRGMSEIVVENSSLAFRETALVVDSLSRQPGAALRFDLGRNGGEVRFASAPILDDGLIGGWAVVRRYGFSDDQDFATYGPDGVVAYSDLHTYQTNLLAAATSDNVSLLSNDVSLTGDKNINALKLRNSDISLQGYTLTLESGGLLLQRFGDTISGGQLTAGTTDGAELLVSGIGSIEADIVDNNQGAVGLTYASDTGNLQLSGNNTYSGPTVFSAGTGNSVELFSETALPAGTDLKVSGTDLRFTYDSDMPLVLGDIVVVDNGLIRSSANNPPALQPNSIQIESGEISGLDILGDFLITKTSLGDAFLRNNLATHTGPIVIEEGRLLADAFGAAPLDDEHAITIHRGATLQSTGSVILADRKIRLDGGILDITLRNGITAPVEVLSGGMALRGSTTITSPMTGDGPLVVEGGFGNGVITFQANLNAFQGPLLFTGGTTNMSGSNPNYSQPIEVAAANLTVTGAEALGTGEVTILPEGRINIVNAVTGNLILAGGALGMSPNNTLGSPTLSGNLNVTQDSYLFVSPLFDGKRLSPVVQSELHLSDQTNLKISPDIAFQPDAVAGNVYFHQVQEQITLAGDIVVHGEASFTSFDALVRLAGAIRPGTEQATLDLIGNDTFDFLGSIQLEDSKSLAVTVDGQAVPLTLAGPNNSLKGNGTYIGNIEVNQGASIAPGSSTGELTIVGDTTIRGGAIYQWEIASPAGTPGEAWDFLQVNGDVHFAATSAAPWILQISDLPGFSPALGQPWLIASAANITGFDPAAVRFDITGIADAWPSLTPDDISLYTHNGNLYLQAIPEPASSLLTAGGFLVAASLRRRIRI